MQTLAQVLKWDPTGDGADAPSAVNAPPMRYCAFLSYSHQDEEVARWLHDSLERFRVPPALVGRRTKNGTTPARLTPIFRDRHELAASTDLGAEIREALYSSRFLIVLCSPAAAKSRWTNAEIDMFKRHRPDGCVLAAIVSGEPFASDIPGREDEECLPPALRQRYDRRGRPTAKKAEPLAADLRGGKDGRRLGFLKIVAGMLDVGLDELVQRETLRRQRRMAMVAAAAIAGMGVTSTLALAAIEARDDAQEQRREAEGLVGFMLGDLKDKLEPLGRLDTLDAVGSRALAYFEKQDKSELTDDALAQRSRALTLMGEIANSRGDLDGALRRYREAFVSTEELLRRSPEDSQRMFDHAQNVYWVGQIDLQRGDTAGAERNWRQYKQLADRLVASDPANRKWRMEAKYADTNLGIVLFQQRRFGEAVRQFQQSLATMEALLAADPNSASYQQSLLESLAWLADAQFGEGRVDDALAQRERQIAMLARLIRSPHSDVEYRRQAVAAHRSAGRLYVARGDVDEGLKHLRRSVALGEELMSAEPDNADWAGKVAGPYLDLGESYLAAGRPTEAGIATRAGCSIASRLITRDSTVTEWSVTLRSTCLGGRARLALAAGGAAEAAALSRQLVGVAAAEAKRTPATETLQALANAHLLRAIVAGAVGDLAGARAAFSAAADAWPRNVGESPLNMSRKVLLLEGLGRRAEAVNLARRLETIGFRHPTYLHDLELIRQSSGRTA